jgi:hypothetical protein
MRIRFVLSLLAGSMAFAQPSKAFYNDADWDVLDSERTSKEKRIHYYLEYRHHMAAIHQRKLSSEFIVYPVKEPLIEGSEHHQNVKVLLVRHQAIADNALQNLSQFGVQKTLQKDLEITVSHILPSWIEKHFREQEKNKRSHTVPSKEKNETEVLQALDEVDSVALTNKIAVLPQQPHKTSITEAWGEALKQMVLFKEKDDFLLQEKPQRDPPKQTEPESLEKRENAALHMLKHHMTQKHIELEDLQERIRLPLDSRVLPTYLGILAWSYAHLKKDFHSFFTLMKAGLLSDVEALSVHDVKFYLDIMNLFYPVIETKVSIEKSLPTTILEEANFLKQVMEQGLEKSKKKR